MASLNFPETPTLGQEYTSDGKTWVFNGVAWDALNQPLDVPITARLTGIHPGDLDDYEDLPILIPSPGEGKLVQLLSYGAYLAPDETIVPIDEDDMGRGIYLNLAYAREWEPLFDERRGINGDVSPANEFVDIRDLTEYGLLFLRGATTEISLETNPEDDPTDGDSDMIPFVINAPIRVSPTTQWYTPRATSAEIVYGGTGYDTEWNGWTEFEYIGPDGRKSTLYCEIEDVEGVLVTLGMDLTDSYIWPDHVGEVFTDSNPDMMDPATVEILTVADIPTRDFGVNGLTFWATYNIISLS
jgi:hypothetical protein